MIMLNNSYKIILVLYLIIHNTNGNKQTFLDKFEQRSMHYSVEEQELEILEVIRRILPDHSQLFSVSININWSINEYEVMIMKFINILRLIEI